MADQDKAPQAIVVMGVSGSGKTSVGKTLAEALGWPFYDGDNFHPQANVDKMARCIPLDDTDRQPWLESLHTLIVENLTADHSLIVACSALKARYRETLKGGQENVVFVFLQGDFDLIYARMQARSGHYMKPKMLRSQFHDLEYPSEAITVSIQPPVAEIVNTILQRLG